MSFVGKHLHRLGRKAFSSGLRSFSKHSRRRVVRTRGRRFSDRFRFKKRF